MLMITRQSDNVKSKRLWIYFILPLLPAFYLFFQCVYVLANRLLYPYELEWIEGGILQSVLRITDGLPLYSAPTMDYVPPLYAPLYFYVASLSTWIFGKGLPALRIVSLTASVLSSVMVSASLWKLTRSRVATLLSILCWGAMFRQSGNWYDVARADSLWAFCLTAALTSLVFYNEKSEKWYLGTMLLSLLLAIFCKQTSLMLVPFFLLAIWCWVGFRTAFTIALLLLVLVFAVAGVLEWESGGYFLYYTMKMANTHHFNPGIPMNFLHGDLLLNIPVYLLLCAWFIISCLPSRRDALAWSCLLFGYLLMSLLSRWYSGGYLNVLLPLHQLVLVMAVCGFSRWLQWASGIRSAGWRHFAMGFASLLFGLNILIGWYKPLMHIPTAADRDCGDALVKKLSQVDGDVCVSKHGYLGFLAGKSFCAHEAFAVDVLNGSNKDFANALLTDIRKNLLDGRYQVLLLDNQAQFSGYGINFKDLAYTATDLDCPKDAFYPVLVGQRPLHWLEYNGDTMRDFRAIH